MYKVISVDDFKKEIKNNLSCGSDVDFSLKSLTEFSPLRKEDLAAIGT